MKLRFDGQGEKEARKPMQKAREKCGNFFRAAVASGALLLISACAQDKNQPEPNPPECYSTQVTPVSESGQRIALFQDFVATMRESDSAVVENFIITVDSVNRGPESTGWSGHIVEVSIDGGPDADISEGILRSNSPSYVPFLPEVPYDCESYYPSLSEYCGSLVIAQWALLDGELKPNVEIWATTTDVAVNASIVESDVHAQAIDNPACEGYEDRNYKQVEVSFSKGIQIAGMSRGFRDVSAYSNINLDVIEEELILAIDPNSASVGLGGSLTEQYLREGESEIFESLVTHVQSLSINTNENNIEALISLSDGVTTQTYDINEPRTAVFDDYSGATYRVTIVPSTHDDFLVVRIRIVKMEKQLHDGDVIETASGRWRVSLNYGETGDALTSITFTGVD